LTVGNGKVGAIVWSENGLTMQVSGVDTSSRRRSGGPRESLDDAGAGCRRDEVPAAVVALRRILSTTYDTGRTVSILGAAGSEVIGIHVADSRTNVTAIALDLSLWI